MCRIQRLLWRTSESRDNPMWANFGELCCVVSCRVVCAVWCVVLCCDVWHAEKFPCVRSQRPRVHVQNVSVHHAHMLKHMCAWCRHTRGRFLNVHTGVLIGHHHTTHHTHHNTHNTPQHTTHKTTHNTTTTQHHTQQHTETETERDRERRQRERREDERRKTREDER